MTSCCKARSIKSALWLNESRVININSSIQMSALMPTTAIRTPYSSQYEVNLTQMPVYQGPPGFPSGELTYNRCMCPIESSSSWYISRPCPSCAGCLHHLFGSTGADCSIPATPVQAYFPPALYRWLDVQSGHKVPYLPRNILSPTSAAK